jgi:hypothetical protein
MLFYKESLEESSSRDTAGLVPFFGESCFGAAENGRGVLQQNRGIRPESPQTQGADSGAFLNAISRLEILHGRRKRIAA